MSAVMARNGAGFMFSPPSEAGGRPRLVGGGWLIIHQAFKRYSVVDIIKIGKFSNFHSVLALDNCRYFPPLFVVIESAPNRTFSDIDFQRVHQEVNQFFNVRFHVFPFRVSLCRCVVHHYTYIVTAIGNIARGILQNS